MIAKYGRSWRGIKPKVAAEHGAVGCLIYSDPRGRRLPRGRHVSRGPVPAAGRRAARQRAGHAAVPGDPLTPGRRRDRRTRSGSTAPRRRRFRRFPVQPLSWADAQPLLAAIGGRPAPGGWAGRPADHVSRRARPRPGAPQAALRLAARAGVRRDRPHPRRGAAGRVGRARATTTTPGSTAPRIRSPGAIAVLEEARAYGALLKQGWRPRRTIVLALWDGEEPMLLGSTEWARDPRRGAARGARWPTSTPTATAADASGASGSPSLARLLSEVAREVPDPETGMSVWKRSHLGEIAAARDADAGSEARERDDLAHRPAGLRLGLHRLLPSPRHPVAQPRLRRRGRRRHLPLDLRQLPLVHDLQRHRPSSTAARWRRRSGSRRCASRAPTCCPTSSAASPSGSPTNLKEVQDLQTAARDSIEEQNRQVEESTFVAMNDPRRPLVAPGARGRAALPQFRAAAERRDPAQVGHLPVRDRLRRGDAAGAGPRSTRRTIG